MAVWRSRLPDGLLLPSGIVQPFPLGFRRDDYHVIAFIEGHGEYEAVEAMVSVHQRGAHAIRAILTRHDQTQIDHINDPLLLEAMRGAKREICERPVFFELQDLGGRKRIRLAFESHRGEEVVLDVTTVGPVSPAGAGLTDPGRHSRSSSLPIMFREASALASPESGVKIGGIACAIPVAMRQGTFVAHRAFFTDGFAMAVIRAGARIYSVVSTPDRLKPGAEWRFQADGRSVSFRVAASTDDGSLRITRSDDARETIFARARDAQLELLRIEKSSRSRATLTLRFDGGGFGFTLAGAGDLVGGSTAIAANGGETTITLAPTEPDWTRIRPVAVSCARQGQQLALRTTIGAR